MASRSSCSRGGTDVVSALAGRLCGARVHPGLRGACPLATLTPRAPGSCCVGRPGPVLGTAAHGAPPRLIHAKGVRPPPLSWNLMGHGARVLATYAIARVTLPCTLFLRSIPTLGITPTPNAHSPSLLLSPCNEGMLVCSSARLCVGLTTVGGACTHLDSRLAPK